MWAEGILAERCLLGARVSGNVGSVGRPDVHVRGHAHFLAHSHIRSSPRPRSPSRPCLRLYSYLPTHICVHGHRLGCASSRSRSRDCAHVCVHVLARAPLRARVHEHTLCVNIRLAFCPRSQPSAAADYVQTAVRGSAMRRPSDSMGLRAPTLSTGCQSAWSQSLPGKTLLHSRYFSVRPRTSFTRTSPSSR